MEKIEKMGSGRSIEEHLRVGSKVEVFCDEYGFQNALYSAVILRPPCSNSSRSSSSSSEKKRKRSSDSEAFIQYDHFLTYRDRKPLTDYVDVSYIRPLPPSEGPDEQVIELYDVVDAFYRDVWWTGDVVKVVGDKYYVAFKNPPDVLVSVRSQVRLHWDWVRGTWNRPQKQLYVTYSPDFKPHYPHACNSTKKSTIATQNESSGTRMKNTEEETSFSTNKGDSQKERRIKEQEVGRLGKLPTLSLKYKRRQLMPKSEFRGTWTATLKSRVISPKSQSKNVECLATGSNSEVLTVSHAEESSSLPNENDVGVSNEIQGKGKEDKLSIAIERAAAVGDQLNRAAAIGNCRTDKSELTVGVSGSEEALRDRTALVSATDCLAEEAMLVVSNNQPLSMYINEICSIENANYSGSTGDIEQNNSLSLPFVKTFSIWQQFESMEVFRKLPQNPHFQPLMKSKGLCREGLAVGNMFAFVSLVEMIAKLEIDAPAELFNDATETLAELEKMGFNVEALRGRLNELQLIQVKLRQLQDDSEGVKTKITYSTHKRTKVNEEVYELCKEIQKLVERKARLITESVAISTELDMWQSVVADIMEDISRMKQNFLVLRRV